MKNISTIGFYLDSGGEGMNLLDMVEATGATETLRLSRNRDCT